MSDDDKMFAAFLAVFGLPMLLPQVRRGVVGWLIEHDIAVRAGEGLVTVPWLEVDITARLAMLLALLILMVAATFWLRGRGRRASRDARTEQERR